MNFLALFPLLANLDGTSVTVAITGLSILAGAFLKLNAVKRDLSEEIINRIKAEQSDTASGKLPQPVMVQMQREFASATGLQNHAKTIHGRVDALEQRVTAVVKEFNEAMTEVKVHLAKMDERSASNHQQLIAMSERLNHVAEDIAALRGRKA